MRRTLAIAVAALTLFAITGCEPPSTITATPSTLRPGCDQITTVTGIGKPAAKIRYVVIETGGGTDWEAWYWFPTGASDEKRQEIRGTVNADGTYTLTYAPPLHQVTSVRLRVRGYSKPAEKTGPVTKSWYTSNTCTDI